MQQIIAILLSVIIFIVNTLSSGCRAVANAEDLMSGITPHKQTVTRDIKDSVKAADFAVRLLQKTVNGEQDGRSTLVSPLSVLCALSMTANGADNDTLSQMEQALGDNINGLNEYLSAYTASLPSAEKYHLLTANSIWIKEDDKLSVEPGFLQTNADYYGASVYKLPFDNAACSAINEWVDNNTEGKIKKIIDNISDDTVMYLINALSFEAEWKSVYKDTQISRGQTFTKEDGGTQNCTLMRQSLYEYISDENAGGFIKNYADGKYAFAAILPDEGVSVSDYLNALSGEKLNRMLTNVSNEEVITALPKFRGEFSYKMTDILRSMGMTEAFDRKKADFSKLGRYEDGNIWIGEVIHKTFIDVDERGTKAGAVTAVAMDSAAEAVKPDEPKRVILDRPFIYMIIDREANLPIFIGTVMEIS